MSNPRFQSTSCVSWPLGLGTVWIGTVLIGTVLIAAASAGAARPPRGYDARPCGFDLDDDGRRGEPADDCDLCDGVTTDPDGDGISEDLIYVDAQNGSDGSGDGSPGNPYRSLQFALNQADGPGDGAEDVVCFRGTFSEPTLIPRVSGVAGVRIGPRQASQARDWEYSTNPAMLVGWDFDDDGAYPPWDTDDVAVLDGSGLDRAFLINDPEVNGGGLDHLELAHFSARDFGFQTGSTREIGFMKFGSSFSSPSEHIYVHDVELVNINRGKPLDSRAITFDFFTRDVRWIAIENLEALNTGSYFARGTFNGSGSGPVRFQNLGYTARGCGIDVCGNSGQLATVTGFKLWGIVDGIEILDSVFDTEADAWGPRRLGPTNGIIANNCSRDWVVRNNVLVNWMNALGASGADNACTLRPTDDVLYDSNLVIADAATFSLGVNGFSLGDDGSASPETSVEDVTAVNNIFYSRVGWRTCFNSQAGNDQAPGTGLVVFSGNTCYGQPRLESRGIIWIEVGQNGTIVHPLPRFRIENNVIAGFEPGRPYRAMVFDYVPTELVLNHNVFDPIAGYDWLNSHSSDLAGWRADSGQDANSRACAPSFVDAAAGDLHLAAGDVCARNIGGDLSAYTVVDVDGEPRAEDGVTDAGADRVGQIFVDGFESGSASAWTSSVP